MNPDTSITIYNSEQELIMAYGNKPEQVTKQGFVNEDGQTHFYGNGGVIYIMDSENPGSGSTEIGLGSGQILERNGIYKIDGNLYRLAGTSISQYI
ncbi:hypothetical protein BK708_02815 [Bacillus thuringiensis serovar yunnanensis]|nr:hypothetical protein BK708_02815 [Bacillus thuringiensis serovar yunnanensis]